MKYMGSKGRIKDDILNIINKAADVLNIDNYYEPFVGGCNIIPYVNIPNRFGSDLNKYLVDFINYIREHGVEELPEYLAYDDYYIIRDKTINVPNWLYFYYMCFGSFNGNFGRGYRAMCGDCNKLLGIKNSLRNELNYLSNFDIKHCSYDELDIKNHSIVYCDPPYRNTEGYGGTGIKFDHDRFEAWAIEKSKTNFVIISEYYMRKPFKAIQWIQMDYGFKGGSTKPIEGIFLIKGGYGVKQYLKSVEDIDIEL